MKTGKWFAIANYLPPKPSDRVTFTQWPKIRSPILGIISQRHAKGSPGAHIALHHTICRRPICHTRYQSLDDFVAVDLSQSTEKGNLLKTELAVILWRVGAHSREVQRKIADAEDGDFAKKESGARWNEIRIRGDVVWDILNLVVCSDQAIGRVNEVAILKSPVHGRERCRERRVPNARNIGTLVCFITKCAHFLSCNRSPLQLRDVNLRIMAVKAPLRQNHDV